MRGDKPPESEKPVPCTAAKLTVIGKIPEDDKVTDCDTFELRATSPKFKLFVLTANDGAPLPNLRAKFSDTPPALAVSVTVCDVLTEVMVAAKPALAAPAGTFTVAGTAAALLLLPRPTVNPALPAAAFSVTVQLSFPAAVIDPLEQVRPFNTGTPVPLRLTTVDVPADELLVNVKLPDAAPIAVGSNCTVSVAV